MINLDNRLRATITEIDRELAIPFIQLLNTSLNEIESELLKLSPKSCSSDEFKLDYLELSAQRATIQQLIILIKGE